MANSGIFSPNDVVGLMDYQQWKSVGDLELIETATISGSVSTVEFENLEDYNVHLLTVNDGTVSADNKGIAFRLYENGTLESGSVYHTARQICGSGGGFSENKSTSNSALRFADNVLVSSYPRCNINGYLYFYNLLDDSKYSFVTQHSSVHCNANEVRSFFGSQALPQASYVNQIQVMAYDSGTIDSGNFALYGIRNS